MSDPGRTAGTDTPAYDNLVEEFQQERDVDMRAIATAEPWSLAAAKARLLLPSEKDDVAKEHDKSSRRRTHNKARK